MESDLVFKNGHHLVIILNHTIKSLLKHAQLGQMDTEAAGVLIGERREGHIIINKISEPGPGDVRSRSSVNRVSPHHQELVYSEFRNSKGTQQYIGEWHTHPENHPTPSPLDKRSWMQEMDQDGTLITAIVGRKSIWPGKVVNRKVISLNCLNRF